MARLPVSAAVVSWAIEQSGHSVDEIAEATRTDPDTVLAWMRDEEKPTVSQGRSLARKLKRPLALLLWSSPPEEPAPSVAFRSPIARDMRDLSADERRYIRQADRIREGAAWLRGELGETVRLPTYGTDTNPSDAARSVRRRLLRISAKEQQAWSSDAVALRAWRARFEDLGILVLFFPIGADACRGISIPDARAPVIVVNTTALNHAARTFSLFHELGHLLTRTASACAVSAGRHDHNAELVERWCEEFAASALMPWRDVEAFLKEKGAPAVVTDLRVASSLARRFRVSLRAAALRLIKDNRARWTLWDAIPVASDAKSKGGQPPDEPRTTPIVRLDEYGRGTTRLFVRGMEADVIDRSRVASYLRVGDVALGEIEERLKEA